MTSEQLDERVAYMTILPERLNGKEFEAALAGRGIAREAQFAMKQASPAQLKHDLRVYRKP
jgi:hypothetical protein